MLLCLVLLLSPYLSFSYHTSYTHGGKHFVIRSNDDPKQPESLPCSAIHAGRSGSDGLPLMHRSHPCSGLGEAQQTHAEAPAEDVLQRDALRINSLLGEEDCSPAPAPTSPGTGARVPTKGDPLRSLPGALQYHVTVGFGTPVQRFTVGFETATNGATLLQCKPCATYPEPCSDSFDPSASSSLAHVPCGSPDCPFQSCPGRGCTVNVNLNRRFRGNATFVTDKLTLSPSSTVDKFRFACLEAGLRTTDSSSGILDLSRNSHSLASRAPSSLFTVAFSYCLPAFKNNVGFLSIGAVRPEFSGRNVSYTPLRSNAANGNLYFLELVGIGVGGPNLPIPPTTLAGNSLLDLHTTFTYLKPEVYKVLRDNFREWMTHYRRAAPREGLDTCYDFTGLNIVVMPAITLNFAGGASIDLSIPEMMYFPDPNNFFSIACLAFAATPGNTKIVSVIGAKAQASMEVVYDLRAGKVGFVPYRC
ncbi:hypothetical protein QOZ80_6AG0518640 [Eleusine coracana subsp. coracana]|nr:hypothetical protein QOZ80_6AG0518640 [Eleusine coracana subsp. coracana]